MSARSSGKAYDNSVASGYSYYGMVTVYPDRIEKECQGEISRIPFGEAVYIETADQILLMSPRSKAIVLTSRCVTDGDADRVRQAVFAAVAPMRQRLYKRFASTAPGVCRRLSGRREQRFPTPPNGVGKRNTVSM